MAITDYASLEAAIISWGWRSGDTDYANVVPDLITGCEQVLNYGAGSIAPLRVAEMETIATATLVNGAAALPDDYLEARTVNAGECELEQIAPGQAAAYSTWSGTPRYFTITGKTLNIIGGGDSTVNLTYYAKIPALSNTNTTNWLLTKAPMVYLYGSLVQGAPFMMDAERLQTFGALFQQALAGLSSADFSARYVNTATRVRGPTP